MLSQIEKKVLYKRYFLSASPLLRSIMLFTMFGMSMLLFRVGYSQQPMFIFLAWNLFLAWLPYYFSNVLLKNAGREKHPVIFYVLFVTWLITIPNSFYIITDLFHLRQRDPIPLWFDLSLIFSFSWIGLVLGTISLRQMETVIQQRWKLRSSTLFVLPVMFLISMGIYIGRYLRYNSWDVLSDPFSLARDIAYLCIHPIRHRFDWSMIICFAVLFTLFYITTNHLGKNQHVRPLPRPLSGERGE